MATHRFPILYQSTILTGLLNATLNATGIVVLVDAVADLNHKPRTRYLTQGLILSGFGVLQVGLLTDTEEAVKQGKFNDADTVLMAGRVAAAVECAHRQPYLPGLPVGCLGFGAGGTAALQAAGMLASTIAAAVAVDARWELANIGLSTVLAPTLLVADARDSDSRQVSAAYGQLRCVKELEFLRNTAPPINGEAPEQTIALAASWFRKHLRSGREFAVHD